MALHAVDKTHGAFNIIEADPDILRMQGLVYSPGTDGPWGVFDRGQKAVTACRFWQGGAEPHTPGQVLVTPLPYTSVEPDPSGQTYIYVGHIHDNYPHFLVSTFCRYWPLSLLKGTDYKLLYHSGHDISHWFTFPYVAALFDALDLQPDRFVRFDRSVRLADLIIPCPAFEETGFAHRAFARACNEIGARMAAPFLDRARSDRPLYLSKARLTRGGGCIVNEEDLMSALDRHGVDIAFPETLDLSQQIALFYNRRLIIAQTGSSLHTSIFAPGGRIIGMCYTNMLLSTFPLLDRINSATALYLYPDPDDLEGLPSTDHFRHVFRLADPSRTADDLLRLTDG